LALAALALVVFGAADSYPKYPHFKMRFFFLLTRHKNGGSYISVHITYHFAVAPLSLKTKGHAKVTLQIRSEKKLQEISPFFLSFSGPATPVFLRVCGLKPDSIVFFQAGDVSSVGGFAKSDVELCGRVGEEKLPSFGGIACTLFRGAMLRNSIAWDFLSRSCRIY